MYFSHSDLISIFITSLPYFIHICLMLPDIGIHMKADLISTFNRLLMICYIKQYHNCFYLSYWTFIFTEYPILCLSPLAKTLPFSFSKYVRLIFLRKKINTGMINSIFSVINTSIWIGSQISIFIALCTSSHSACIASSGSSVLVCLG